MKPCPECGGKSVAVGSETLDALLEPAAKAQMGETAYRFCESPDCDDVYFVEDAESIFEKADLSVRVGIKETDAPRPVCYCFDHSIEEIEDEVARTGASTVLDDIRERMKDGCWCETTNPRGACCLGTVSKAIKAAQVRHGGNRVIPERVGEAAEAQPDCCRRTSGGGGRQSSPDHRLWASGGAVLTAVLSSACCWLPLTLIAFGVSGAAAASWLEPWRSWLLGLTAVFLVTGLFLAFRQGGSYMHRIMPGVAAVVALGFGLFPVYSGAFLGGEPGHSTPAAAEEPLAFEVEGMFCEACAAGLEHTLDDHPAVAAARVDFESARATISLAKESDATAGTALAIIEHSGYTGRLVEKETGKEKRS